MPFVTDVFKPVPVAGPGPARVPTGPVLPVDTTRQLHSELAAVGMPVAGVEAGATPQFGPATSAQLKQFQQRYGLPADEVLDPTTGGVLALVAMVATETDRAKLRTELRRAKGQVAHSPQFNYWLARSAILAGDYNLAANVNPHLPDLSGNKVNIDDLVVVDGGGQPPRAPEVPFPENFY